MGLGEAGIVVDGATIALDGAFLLPEVLQHIAKAEVQIGRSRIALERQAKIRGRFAMLPKFPQRIAQVEARDCVVGGQSPMRA